MADGIVIGSKIVNLIKEAGPRNIGDVIRNYCRDVSRPQSHATEDASSHEINLGESIEPAKVDTVAIPTASINGTESEANGPLNDLEGVKAAIVNVNREHLVF
jgi:hypothetical protein